MILVRKQRNGLGKRGYVRNWSFFAGVKCVNKYATGWNFNYDVNAGHFITIQGDSSPTPRTNVGKKLAAEETDVARILRPFSKSVRNSWPVYTKERGASRWSERDEESARMTARPHKSSAFKRIYEPERKVEAEKRNARRREGKTRIEWLPEKREFSRRPLVFARYPGRTLGIWLNSEMSPMAFHRSCHHFVDGVPYKIRDACARSWKGARTGAPTHRGTAKSCTGHARKPAGTALTAGLHWLSQWLIKHSNVQRSNNARLAAQVPLDVRGCGLTVNLWLTMYPDKHRPAGRGPTSRRFWNRTRSRIKGDDVVSGQKRYLSALETLG